MMSDLFEKRVEAAAEAIGNRRSGKSFNPGLIGISTSSKGWSLQDAYKWLAEQALTAADAVVTEEQIAEVLRPLIREHQGADDNDAWWVADHAHDYAQAVLALFRGGVK